MALLVKKYPVFEDNQVLTSSQLNNLVEYLDEQNRMTRVALIGVGIACGLEIKCESSQNGDSLIISKGVGVTSQGYLVKMCGDCVMTRVRPYLKPEIVDYDPFEDVAGFQDVVLHELLSADAETDPSDEIRAFNKSEFDDYAVILYIECFDKDLKSCLGKSCDELGIDRFLNLRKLLISRADLQKVLERTEGGYQDNNFPDQFSLPQVLMPRSLFRASHPESELYSMYAANYISSISSIYFDLVDALKESYDIYEPALGPVYGENPFEGDMFQNIQSQWIEYGTASDTSPIQLLGVQYFYDFMKDLILAYIEFRDNACDLASLCCPDTDRFPKHLILGYLNQNSANGTTSEARHGFTQTPIYGNQKGLLTHVITLHQKIVLLIESFELDRLRVPTKLELTTKVTPSCEKKSYLSERTIPFYQNISATSQYELNGNLVDIWRGINKPRLGRKVLSYDKHKPKKPNKSEVVSPLEYDLDAYNFLRIEGHLGQDVKTVMNDLEAIKSQNNLEFEVKPIYLGAKGLELGYPECLCSDIQPDYSIWRNKTLCYLKSLLSITTRLSDVLNKRSSLTSAFLKSYRTDSGTVNQEGASKSAAFASKSFAAKSDFNPISVNPVKLSNFTDVELNVNSNNWEFAGQQIIASLDNVAQAEKSSNDRASLSARSFNSNPSASDYLNEFNNCLCKLISSMKVDLKDFDLDEWKKHYSCLFEIHISIMKRLASDATNAQATLQSFIIIFIYCTIYKVLCFLGRWPYIAIGVISDTLKFRKEKFQESLKFSNFLKTQPGVDHKAGVPPGGTFLLLYLSKLESDINIDKALIEMSERSNIENPFESLKDKLEEMNDAHEKFEGTVIGDFTLNGACCDDCGDMPNAALTLDPLGLPKCGVVIPVMERQETDESSFFNEFRPLTMKTISYVYDRELYRIRNTNEPQFGSLKFEIVSSSFEKNCAEGNEGEPKQIQQMTYTVDLEKVTNFQKENPNVGIIPDEFDYEIFDTSKNNEVVCKNTVTIFIPIISRDINQEPDLAEVTGNVVGNNANGGPIFDAKVSVVNSNVADVTTDDNGFFLLLDVPYGNYILAVAKDGFFTNEVPITVDKNPVEVGTIILVQQKIVEDLAINLDAYLIGLNVQPGTTESIRLAKNYVRKSKSNDELMIKLVDSSDADLRPVFETSAASIKQFSSSDKLNGAGLNKEFRARSEELMKVFGSVKDDQKNEVLVALQTLTTSYLDRLSILQPKTLTTTTVKTLQETSEAFNQNPNLRMKSVVDKWVKNEAGNVSTSFAKSVKTNLQIKR